jgi:hypothetical protein
MAAVATVRPKAFFITDVLDIFVFVVALKRAVGLDACGIRVQI